MIILVSINPYLLRKVGVNYTLIEWANYIGEQHELLNEYGKAVPATETIAAKELTENDRDNDR
jgi:hypothetical protein